jgi:hypothetical protein
MSEKDDKSVAELEDEYKELIASRISALKKENEEAEKIRSIQNGKSVDLDDNLDDDEDDDAKFQAAVTAKKEKDQKAVEFQARVDAEVQRLLNEEKVEGGDIDLDDPNDTTTDENGIPEKLAFIHSYAQSQKLKFDKYETLAESYLLNGSEAFIATDSDSGCEDDVSAWERADCFADVIWQSVICRSDFLTKGITVKGLDFSEGCGGKVQIRVINHASPSSDFGAMSPCTCLTCVSNTFTTYTLTMEVYGDYKVLCDLDLFTAGSVVKKAIMDSMSIVAQERIDNKIYSELSGATPTYTSSLGASCGGSIGTDGDCCTYTVDLYNKIVDLEATMRNAGYFKGVDPILILNPTVAAYLKYKDGLSMPSYIAANISMDGLKLAGIGNIKVIESCHAGVCTTTGAAVQAILIDPSRAIGEAWGKRPTFKVDDDPIECSSQKVVLTMWADFAALDTAAIGHILNP